MNCVENYEQRDVERRHIADFTILMVMVYFFHECRTGAGVESRFVVAQGVSSPDSDTLLVTFFSCCVVSGVSSYHSETNSHLWYDLSRTEAQDWHKTDQ
jgi:hypothetical protein